ncbi:methionyl-tRNA formyltransferase [Candidatus Termititenax persephonae]|uniref:Methionyl-tRNA formyltransferase n=1 Tax=Candidatus Termititenax persephonae TaxID=2218525 RepID=A0A388TG47_9BACT|nr:methionyl-tRNA formyltransferase [Candidatus Termititenax persephonae]
MRLAFFGSPEFALPAFRKLQGQITLVVTRPDQPARRGWRRQSTAVKKIALENGLPVLETIPCAADLKAIDKIVVVAYGSLIPEEIVGQWECINLHPSLLPKYRGASPLQSALLNGETKTGVTTMLLNARMDAGDILLQEEIAIGENLNFAELQGVCAERGAELLWKTLAADVPKIRRPQDEKTATYCRKITKEDSLIVSGEDAWQVHNKVRAVGGYVFHKNKRVKILATRYTAAKLELVTVQPEGRQPMSYAAFRNGYGEIIL